MNPIYELVIKSDFSAAHRLMDYSGECAHMHGHNWGVEITVECTDTGANGFCMDFRELKKATDDVLKLLDHKNLNDIPEFSAVNPTAEKLAEFIYRSMKAEVAGKGGRLARVKVVETPEFAATYRELT